MVQVYRRVGWLVGLITLVFMMGVSSVYAQRGIVQIVQWASDAEASSQYGARNWNAEQATGAPNVLACQDDTRAWASRLNGMTRLFRQPG